MSNEKDKSKTAFDKQAQAYDTENYGSHARSLYPILLKKISDMPYCSALDLGCGTGEMMRLILEQDSSKELTGLDLSEQMLDVARRKLGDKVKLFQGDSEHLPFPDDSFDLVYCNDSFHHYPAPDRVLAEIWRVIRGGVYLLWVIPIILSAGDKPGDGIQNCLVMDI